MKFTTYCQRRHVFPHCSTLVLSPDLDHALPFSVHSAVPRNPLQLAFSLDQQTLFLLSVRF